MQAYGSKRLDASLLLIPMVGFLPPEDPARLLSRCNDVGLLAEDSIHRPVACWAIFRKPIVTSV